MEYSRQDKIRLRNDFGRLQKSMALEAATLELFQDNPVVTKKQLDQNFQELVDQHSIIASSIERQLLDFTATNVNDSAGIAQIEELYWNIRHQRLDYQRNRRDFFRQAGYLSLPSQSQSIPILKFTLNPS